MDVLDVNNPSRPPLTGGNATELGIGSSRRRSGVVIRENAGQPQEQARGVTREGDVDPFKLGFDRIMSRFDQLEMRMDNSDRRMDNMEGRPLQEDDLSVEESDSDDREYRSYRDPHGQPKDCKPRRQAGYRGGRPPRGGRKDVYRGRDSYRREEGASPDTRPRRTTSWDRPSARLKGGPTRRPTVWDSPRHREQGAWRHGGDDNTGVTMRAPHFDGSNATNWISRVEYYFNHKLMPEEDRLHYTVMLFEPPAAEWIFNYQKNNPYVTWPEFLEDVRHRFDPQSFKNYTGPLAKLVQTGSVTEYHNTFERYLDRVQGLSDEALIPIFIEGLKQPLQETVELQQPQSLAEAMALALRLGASQEQRAQQAAATQKRQWQNRDSRLAAGAPTTSSAPPPTGAPSTNTRFAPVRVSLAEKSERSRKGLCWHCPEKYTPGHVCAVKLLCYVGEEDDEDTRPDTECQLQDDHVITADLSHLHSLNGNSRSRPFRVTGNIGSTEVGVLIDTGSTHDFLHPRIAERLQLALTPIRPFRVYVGNGASLLCAHVSRRTKLTIQGAQFLVDLHILEVHGADVILGMDWLESLGKISADFVGKTLEFRRGEDAIVLKGDRPGPQQLSLNSLMMLAAHSPSHEFYEIVPFDSEPGTGELLSVEPCFPPDLPPQFRAVLEAHQQVFALPVGMPPKRAFDHKIHLLPNTKPINVRPYRYPYFQKNEIEHQVQEMLEQGIIQKSQSPFSSPVLLIRKKDGSFRFCIDYRALNSATIPDHFPIPTADELFDELGAAKFFTKLDLRSGYH
ncbi:uncharacterized protein LOC121765623 [Salvia splendens]|uniref:uncharacterized protein LOC121765623 n=1 Tax=Salvia splendens TaxID=180675 RepID=UPI001C26024E|nr:uncharacterized protein LOC121765623 [Salvia splendens]